MSRAFSCILAIVALAALAAIWGSNRQASEDAAVEAAFEGLGETVAEAFSIGRSIAPHHHDADESRSKD